MSLEYKDIRINHRIRVPKVRLIGLDGSQIGIVETREALKSAEEVGYDLVEISSTSHPPVCRIMDFGKYMYQLKRQERENRKHQKNVGIKEVKFSIKIFEHDYQTKVNHSKAFLEKGNKVKMTMFLRGREITRADFGFRLLERVTKDLEEYATPDKGAALEGNIISLMFTPKSGKNPPLKGRKENGEEVKEEVKTENQQSGQKAL